MKNMLAGGKPRYPWVMQAICCLIAGGMVAAALLLPARFSSLQNYFLLFELLCWGAALVVLAAPYGIYRDRIEKLRYAAEICHRCEKTLLREGFAMFHGEPVCEECARQLEAIEGGELPRYTKSQSDHVQT